MTLSTLIELKDMALEAQAAIDDGARSLPYEQCKPFEAGRFVLARLCGALEGHVEIHSKNIELMEESA